MFFNVQMTHIMLGQPRILNCAFYSIKVVKAQNIHQVDYQSSWSILKNMTVLLTRFIERNKSKAGLAANVKL